MLRYTYGFDKLTNCNNGCVTENFTMTQQNHTHWYASTHNASITT